ncbi:hypothetical protein T03_6671 [Trichinella britovi]|uniref:Uncharacterized protein n=1 Tax=Trichinella britovi TaxID=45882 RepID=A0A0V0Z1D4_TRIBR|nr:hypothetical protein T03_6671 [Trichinella britovi]
MKGCGFMDQANHAWNICTLSNNTYILIIDDIQECD